MFCEFAFAITMFFLLRPIKFLNRETFRIFLVVHHNFKLSDLSAFLLFFFHRRERERERERERVYMDFCRVQASSRKLALIVNRKRILVNIIRIMVIKSRERQPILTLKSQVPLLFHEANKVTIGTKFSCT